MGRGRNKIGVIVHRMRVRGDRGATTCEVCFDSGAPHSLVRTDVADRIATVPRSPRGYPDLRMADGKTRIHISGSPLLFLTVDRVPIFHPFLVTDDVIDPVLLGADCMQTWKMNLNLAEEEVTIDKRALRRAHIMRSPMYVIARKPGRA